MADQLVHNVVVAHKRSDMDRSQTGLEHQDTEEDNQTLEKASTAPPSCLSENTPPAPPKNKLDGLQDTKPGSSLFFSDNVQTRGSLANYCCHL